MRGWWILMSLLLVVTLGIILYGGVFLLWLHRHGGAQGLRDELLRRLGR